MSDPTDNLIPVANARQRAREDDAILDWALTQPSEPTATPDGGSAPAPAQSGPGAAKVFSGFFRGVSAKNIIGAGADAANEFVQAGADFSEAINRRMSGVPSLEIGFGEDGKFDINLVKDSDLPSILRALPQVPTTERGDTWSENFVRDSIKMVGGYFLSGKLKAMQSLAGAGTAGKVASVFARGAATDMFVGDEASPRMMDLLLKKVPALRNPMTEFVSSQPGDTGAEARFKNAIEGIGMGAAFDVLRAAGSATRGWYRGRMAAVAEGALSEADHAKIVLDEAEDAAVRLKDMLGDPEAPVVSVRKGPPAGDRPPDDLAERLSRSTGNEESEVYINWARIDSGDDVKSVIQKMADTFSAEIGAAQRGVRSWEQTKLSADQIDAFDAIAKRRTGEAFNAETMTAARELWVRSGTQLRSLARAAVGGGDAEQIAFLKQVEIHRAIQAEVIGARTEIARALNAMKIPVSGRDSAAQLSNLQQILDSAGDVKSLAKRVAQAELKFGRKGIDKLVEAGRWAKTEDALGQVWYAMILSNPVTHARVAVSNFATLAQVAGTRKGANVLGRMLGDVNVATGETSAGLFAAAQAMRDSLIISSQARRSAIEAGKRIASGDIAGAKEVLGASEEQWGRFYTAFTTGKRELYTGTPEIPKAGAFDPAVWGLDRKSVLGRAFDWVETATSLPGRSLNAIDEVFGGAAYRFEITSRAFRQASEELRIGQIGETDFGARLAQLTHEPEEVAKLSAAVLAEQVSMRQRPPANSPVYPLLRGMNHLPVIGKVVMPFPRTTWNVANFGLQYTPLAPMVRQWRNDIAKGGAEADIAWTKLTTGSLLLTTFLDLAMEGRVTGSGAGDEGVRASREAQGIQPNSIRIGGENFSYRGMGPLTELLGMAANFADIMRVADFEDDDGELSDVFATAALAVGQQTVSATYMRGASDLVAMISPNAEPYEAKQMLNNLVSSLVPAAVGHASRVADPDMREAFNMTDAFRRKYQSDALAYARDRWGRKKTYSSGKGSLYDAISPVYVREEKPEAIDLELDRLETAVLKPSRQTSIRGVNVDLSKYPHIYSRYVQLQGEALLPRLNDLVSGGSPESNVYLRMTDGPEGGKALMIRNIVEMERGRAREMLIQEFPELEALVMQRRQEKQEALKPSIVGF